MLFNMGRADCVMFGRMYAIRAREKALSSQTVAAVAAATVPLDT